MESHIFSGCILFAEEIDMYIYMQARMKMIVAKVYTGNFYNKIKVGGELYTCIPCWYRYHNYRKLEYIDFEIV